MSGTRFMMRFAGAVYANNVYLSHQQVREAGAAREDDVTDIDVVFELLKEEYPGDSFEVWGGGEIRGTGDPENTGERS